MLDHIRHGFQAAGNRLRPVDGDTTIAAGVSVMMAPGHTPRHLCVVVASQGHRALLPGAHFPELQFGRVLAGQGRRWLT